VRPGTEAAPSEPPVWWPPVEEVPVGPSDLVHRGWVEELSPHLGGFGVLNVCLCVHACTDNVGQHTLPVCCDNLAWANHLASPAHTAVRPALKCDAAFLLARGTGYLSDLLAGNEH
jgi:hypothetical protein